MRSRKPRLGPPLQKAQGWATLGSLWLNTNPFLPERVRHPPEEIMRPLRLIVALLLLTLVTSYSVSQQVVADVVKQSSDAVVLIVISNSAGQETALGSGFLVSADGEIVTNHHVIKDAHSANREVAQRGVLPRKRRSCR